MRRGHWEFSHFEWVEIPCWDFWGRYRPRYERRAVEVYVREIRITVTIELETFPLEQETRRLWALKNKVDAQVALIDSCIELSRKTAELERLHAVAAREAPKQIAYRPDVPVQRVRSGRR